MHMNRNFRSKSITIKKKASIKEKIEENFPELKKVLNNKSQKIY